MRRAPSFSASRPARPSIAGPTPAPGFIKKFPPIKTDPEYSRYGLHAGIFLSQISKLKRRTGRLRGAHASGVFFSASRRKTYSSKSLQSDVSPQDYLTNEFGRDARTCTRDACAPISKINGY